MQIDAIILTQDVAYGQYIRLALKGHLAHVVLSSSLDALPEARYLIIDLDTMPLPDHLFGTVLATSHSQDRPAAWEHLWLDRPFRKERLLAVLGLAVKSDTLPLYPLIDRTAVMVDGEEVSLSEREYKLFMLLWERRGTFVSHSLIQEAVWGREGDPSLVNVYIHYLRKKLAHSGRNYIVSHRGEGYLLQEGGV